MNDYEYRLEVLEHAVITLFEDNKQQHETNMILHKAIKTLADALAIIMPWIDFSKVKTEDITIIQYAIDTWKKLMEENTKAQ